CTLVIILLVGMGGLARADVNTYTDRPQFNSASMSLQNIDFEGLAPSGGYTYYGNPGTLTLNGVRLDTNHLMFVQNRNYYNTGAFMSAQQGGPTQTVTITLPPGTTAIGMDYGGGHAVNV